MEVTIGNNIFSTTKNPDGTYKSTFLKNTEETITIPALPKVLADYESNSSPGIKYQVRYTKESGFYCNCMGFRSHKNCWHVTETLRRMVPDDKHSTNS